MFKSPLKSLAGPLAFLLLATCGLEAAPPESMSFHGVTFQKAFFDKTAAGTLTEYLPKGQSLETWTNLMGYYEFTKLKDPQQSALNLAKVVKEQNPQAQSQVISNDATGEAIVDFVTWPEDGAYVEFNIWKYRKAPSGEGLVALQYAERVYGNAEIFLKKLKNRRQGLVETMAQFSPEAVKP